MFHDADLPVFFSDFATPVRTASGVTFSGIFDREAQIVDLDDSGSHVRTTPRLRCSDDDARLLGRGEIVYIHNQPWRVEATEPDGTGQTIVSLYRTT